MTREDQVAPTEPAPPLLDREQSPTTFWDDLEGTEAGACYDASARTVSILDHEPVAAAMLEAVRARMPRRAR